MTKIIIIKDGKTQTIDSFDQAIQELEKITKEYFKEPRDEEYIRSNILWLLDRHEDIAMQELEKLLASLEQLNYLSEKGIAFREYIFDKQYVKNTQD